MASGEYDKALPVALDAVRQGQELFKSATGHQSIQVFPLYLLAAQANLGLKRARQCEDFLGLAGWLAVKDPEATTTAMRYEETHIGSPSRRQIKARYRGSHHLPALPDS